MTKKEIKILDKEINYISSYADRINCIRIATGINTDYSFLKEVETIEYLYKSILQYRKEEKSNYFHTGTSGWFIEYFRDKKKYNFLWDIFLGLSLIILYLKNKKIIFALLYQDDIIRHGNNTADCL